ncbi:MAG: type II secretion system F family protein [Acutalibacteraceae bacterium]
MFLSTSSVIIMSVGTVVAIIYIVLMMASKKYDYLIEPLTGKEWMLKEVYGPGFLICDMIKYDFTSKKERTRRRDLGLLYDARYTDYYLRVCAAQRISLSLLIVVLGFAIFGLANDILILFVLLIFGIAAYFYFSGLQTEQIKKRSDIYLSDFPDIVSKIALLINAGMILKEAWMKVATTGTSPIYQEMQKTVDDMENGMAEVDAYYAFGTRCVIPEIKKFSSTLSQGVVKGNAELVTMVQEQNAEIWLARKHRAKQQGEKAGSKLMIPIMIMFVGILVVIIVPIFANLGV